MQIRLTRFGGLRFAFSRGWYEIPSHVDVGEVRRLLDLLANTVPEIEDVVTCTWEEIERVPNFAESTLAFVRVPGLVDDGSREAMLDRFPIRLGLFQSEEFGHWPESAWDEIEIKSTLVAWLRTSVRRPNHPLAHLDVAELPVDLLASATSEPIELIELAEGTMEYAARQQLERGQVDWPQCARWSVGRRLAQRLGDSDPELRTAVYQCIAESRDGTVRPLLHPREVDELVRLGLAHRSEGYALLAPIARLAGEQKVIEILEIEGARTARPSVVRAPSRARATSPAEAALAFDPMTPILPDDPWFVDLRPLVPEMREFGKRLNQQLERRDRYVQLAILQEPGSGGSTMLRKLLLDLAVTGLVTIDVRTPVHIGFGFVDLLLAILLAILERCDRESNLELPAEMLVGLRSWLAEISLDGELRDYMLLGAGVKERVRVPSLLVLVRRLIDLASTDSSERTRIRLALDARTDEILEHLANVLAELRGHLAARGQQVCIHIEASEHLAPVTIDDVFANHADHIARLSCHFVFSALLPSYSSAFRPIRDLFSVLVYPTTTSSPSIVRALLDARADLARIFEEPDTMVETIATICGSRLRYVFELAAAACSMAQPDLVTREHLDAGQVYLALQRDG